MGSYADNYSTIRYFALVETGFRSSVLLSMHYPWNAPLHFVVPVIKNRDSPGTSSTLFLGLCPRPRSWGASPPNPPLHHFYRFVRGAEPRGVWGAKSAAHHAARWYSCRDLHYPQKRKLPCK
ncbi:hypothetical protein TRVA0_045S00958 [Trichomonascus vanleenenianus]|uniref:uncharacterized protein n=1 Tax=Trichomonascus vanleenenianus TaxID=2268995 RepID=UPI003EC9DF36